MSLANVPLMFCPMLFRMLVKVRQKISRLFFREFRLVRTMGRDGIAENRHEQTIGGCY